MFSTADIKIYPNNGSNVDMEEYDTCGNTCVAILEVNRMRIPMCDDCMEDLKSAIEKYYNTVFCHQCKHSIMSEYGFKYGCSCKLKAAKDGKELKESDAGYSYCVDSMDTCSNAERRSDNND